MKEQSKIKIRFTICILLFTSFITFCLSTSVWGRSIITGKVIDAETGDAIKGAAVYIYWGKSGSGPPGLAASTVKVEVAEDLTGTEGKFKIPKYSTWFKHYQMAVYKNGYVCWSNEDIFPSYEKRKGFKLKSGMVIKLERFRPEYNRKKHALFIRISAALRPAPGIFNDAIKSERELLKWSIKEKN